MKKTEHTGDISEIVSLTKKFVFSNNLEERKMYLPGQEGIPGVSQKVKYIVPVGCAEINPMIYFLMLIEKKFWLSVSK